MLCFPLDNTEYEAEGLGLEHVTRSRGVFAADDNLRVSAGGGMNVTISPGICFLKMGKYWGVTALQKSALSLPIQTADGTLTRKDAVVARIDKVANLAEIVVKPGTPASSPELPAIVRDDDYDEIFLAAVTVGPGVIEITNAVIQDLRMDESVCGLMIDSSAKLPTDAYNAQLTALLAQIEAELAHLHAGTAVMTKAQYDPQGKNTDIFAYTDGKSAAILKKVEPLTSANAGAHNAIYRGKYLGTSVTETQYAAISAGTFDDLYIGDYWTIGGVNYRIAAFDYYLNCGDTACTTHHVVIVPDTCLYTAQMHNTSSGGYEGGAANTTVGGYVGSDMYKTNLANAKTTIKSAFNGHVLNHRIFLTNAVANGRASNVVWCDSEVDLMCEQMVYGSGIFSPVSDGSNVPTNFRVEKSQLPLFRHEQSRIFNHELWWLRDVISSSNFALIGTGGNADQYGASDSRGVRPAFCIS